jgi:hypothetical protein
MLKSAKFEHAAEAGQRGLQSARQTGRETSFLAALAVGKTAEALLAQGRTGDAAALIDPLTTGPPERDRRIEHGCASRSTCLVAILRPLPAASSKSPLWASSPASTSLGKQRGKPQNWTCGWAGPMTPSRRSGARSHAIEYPS